MATYSQANPPSVSGAVSAAATSSTFNTSGTLYTCPANSYAVVTLGRSGGTMSVDGRSISFTVGQMAIGVHVGPGQEITWSATTHPTSFRVVGVQFTNSI